jgi:hypothetical protein
MTKKMIATMMILASSTCLGFASQGEIEIPVEKYSAITESETGDEVPTLPPVLEKCKKRKH